MPLAYCDLNYSSPAADKKIQIPEWVSGFFGTPKGTRTPDLLIRSQSLYPTELSAHMHHSRRLDIIAQEFQKCKHYFRFFQVFFKNVALLRNRHSPSAFLDKQAKSRPDQGGPKALPYRAIFPYSVRRATTGSFLAALREGMVPAISVSITLMPTRIAAALIGRMALRLGMPVR